MLRDGFFTKLLLTVCGSIGWFHQVAAQENFEFSTTTELDVVPIYAFEEPLDCFAYGPLACQATLGEMFPYFYDPVDESSRAIEAAQHAIQDAQSSFGPADIARSLIGSEAYAYWSMHPDVGSPRAATAQNLLRMLDPITETFGAPSLAGLVGMFSSKCNLFVSDCFLGAGIDLRRLRTEPGGNPYPPTVDHLIGRTETDISGILSDFSRLDNETVPAEGDIYVLGGHVGIIVEADRYVYLQGEAPLAVISASSVQNRVIIQSWPPPGWYSPNYIIWRRND